MDIDAAALTVAALNGRLNALTARLHLIGGGPEALRGAWPLVLANIQAGPLIEMSPLLVRRVAHRGTLILSGVAAGVADDVANAYRRLGMHLRGSRSRSGWSALVLEPSW